MQLNAISLLQRFMSKEQKEALINSFIFSNFNYCALVWHVNHHKKLKRYNFVVQELFTMITLATIKHC